MRVLRRLAPATDKESTEVRNAKKRGKTLIYYNVLANLLPCEAFGANVEFLRPVGHEGSVPERYVASSGPLKRKIVINCSVRDGHCPSKARHGLFYV